MRRQQNLQKSPTYFAKTAVFTSLSSIKTSGRFFSNFCGLLRKAELYTKEVLSIVDSKIQINLKKYDHRNLKLVKQYNE